MTEPASNATPALRAFLTHEIKTGELTVVVQTLFTSATLLLKQLPSVAPDLWQHLFELGRQWPEREALPERIDRVAAEWLTSRCVDNFQVYLVELVKLIFRGRPETLRSSETVELRHVLECRTIEEFVDKTVERKVDTMAYGGFRQILAFLKRPLGVRLELTPADLEVLARAVATRNILVHNRGRANERFLRETGLAGLGIGDEVPLNYDTATAWAGVIRTTVLAIDRAAANHFGPALRSH